VTVTFSVDPDTHFNLVTAQAASCLENSSPASIIFEGHSSRESDAGHPSVGPLTKAVVIDPGSGMATVTRVQPSLAITGAASGATGGTFTFSYSKIAGHCCDDLWRIESISVTGDTSKYVNGDVLTISLGPNDKLLPSIGAGSASIYTKGPPTLSATVATGPNDGSGASLSVNISLNSGSGSWFVDSISVVSGGSKYTDESGVTITAASGDTTVSPAEATARTKLLAPVGKLEVISDAGQYATFLQPVFAPSSPKGYGIAGASREQYLDDKIDNPGEGYSLNDLVVFTVEEGTTDVAMIAYVDLLGPNGEIEGVNIENPGRYWLDTGVVESITVTDKGEYFRPDTPTVVVGQKGYYYGEDPENACVGPIGFSVSQVDRFGDPIPPAYGGSGATFKAVVDSDPSSETYGQLTSVDITNGGSGYLARQYIGEWFNKLDGVPIVLRSQGRSLIDGSVVSTCDFAAVGPCDFEVQLSFVNPAFFPGGLGVSAIGPELTTLQLWGDATDICKSGFPYSAAYQGTTATVDSGGDWPGIYLGNNNNQDVPRVLPDSLTISASAEGPAGWDTGNIFSYFGAFVGGTPFGCDDPVLSATVQTGLQGDAFASLLTFLSSDPLEGDIDGSAACGGGGSLILNATLFCNDSVRTGVSVNVARQNVLSWDPFMAVAVLEEEVDDSLEPEFSAGTLRIIFTITE
jgi:hypothetical protein